MERVGAGLEALFAGLRRRADERGDRELGEQALAEREAVVLAKHEVAEREPVLVVPQAAEVPKSERVVKEQQRPLFHDLPDSPLPPLALLEDAPSAQETVSAETLEYTSRLIERKLADFGVAVKVLAAYPGPGDHALRDRAGGRREGRADRQPDQGPRARAVGGLHPRRRDDPRQVVHGPRAAQSEAADRQAGRDPVVGDVQRQREPADAGARQGHRRQAGDRRPRADAAPAGRRHDRLRQVGRGQRDDPVAALQGRAAAGAPDPDRPEDARALGLRGHPAPAGAGRHRHEARRQRAQLVRRRDGAPLPADVDARRAQPRRLQREGRRGEEGGQAARPIRSR